MTQVCIMIVARLSYHCNCNLTATTILKKLFEFPRNIPCRTLNNYFGQNPVLSVRPTNIFRKVGRASKNVCKLFELSDGRPKIKASISERANLEGNDYL